MQDQTGRKRDHLFDRDPLAVYFPLAVDDAEADRKICNDQLALKAVVLWKAVVFCKEMLADQIGRLLESVTFPLAERIFLSTGSSAAMN